MTMTPAEISIATTRLLADVQALVKSVSNALTTTNADDREFSWRASADALGSIITGVSSLAKGNTTWSTLLGGATTVDALKVSYEKAFKTYTETGNINNVEVGDILGVMGGVSDLGGSILSKPGPQLAVGIALKGLGLGAALGKTQWVT